MMAKLNAEPRRALTLLAGSADGCTEALLLAHDVTSLLITQLVDAGLATTQPEHMHMCGRLINTTNRIKVTGAGRTALAEGR